MKKLLLYTGMLALCLLSFQALVACSSDDDEKEPETEWTVVPIDTDGTFTGTVVGVNGQDATVKLTQAPEGTVLGDNVNRHGFTVVLTFAKSCLDGMQLQEGQELSFRVLRLYQKAGQNGTPEYFSYRADVARE